MTLIVLTIVLFLTVAGGLVALGTAVMRPGAGGGTRLRHMLGIEAPEPRSLGDKLQAAIEPAARILPASSQEKGRTERWLIQAGLREPRHLRLFFSIRGVLVLAPVVVALITGLAARSPLTLVAGPALGFILPRFWLKRKMKARAKRIRLSLPDALDLMVICVESGLGFDQAMQRVAAELKPVHPELCGELDLLALEMRAGAPRSLALRNLTQRCDVDDLRSLAAVLIQSDRFGTSITQSLRVHSEALRIERRQRAEEIAAKTTVKMVPVLALLIFPAVMIVTLGPAILSLARQFLPMLNQ